MRTLTHSPADVLAQLLVDLGVASDPSLWRNRSGSGSAWPAFVAGEPPLPDNVITVYDGTGSDHGSTMFDGELQGHYGFQVRVRAVDHRTCYGRANLIRATLAEAVNAAPNRTGRQVDLGGSVYWVRCVAQLGPVLVLGKNVANEKTNLCTVNGLLNVDQVS